MFASLIMLFIIVLMLVPGIVMGIRRTIFSPSSLLKILAVQTIFFICLSFACKMFPWLIDPRISF